MLSVPLNQSGNKVVLAYLLHRCNPAEGNKTVFKGYHNVPKFFYRQVWANSADPDQTAFRVITANFWVSEILGFLR